MIVVGAGIVGLSVAYFCAKRGASVTVLEARTAGAGASSGNAGWLTPSLPGPIPSPGALRYAVRSLARRDASVVVKPTLSPARLAWLLSFARNCSHRRYAHGLRSTALLALGAFDAYDELVADGLKFDMQPGPITFAFSDLRHAREFAGGLDPLKELGYEIPEVMGGSVLRAAEPALSNEVEGGLCLEGTRFVNPSQLVSALASELRSLGGELREVTPVDTLFAGHGRLAGVRIGDEEAVPDAVVLCAGSWTGQLAASAGARLPIQGGKGYSVSVAVSPQPRGPIALGEPHIACTPFGDRLRLAGGIEVGTIDGRVDQAALNAIIAAASKFLPGLDPGDTTEHWSGLRPLAPSGLPILGRIPDFENLYVATGHGTLGVTLGPITGRHMATLILDGRLPTELEPFVPGGALSDA